MLTSEQGEESKKFREICGVSCKEKWPIPGGEARVRPDTNEVFYTPDFREDVTHPTNTAILEKVALCVMEDLNVR